MRLIFSLLILVGIYANSALGSAINKKPVHRRDYQDTLIIGGDVAERGQFPYQIQIQFIGTHYCGGAILNENWIVTAAHCSDVGIPLNYVVVANQYNIYLNEGLERKHVVSRIIIHPDYDAAYYPNDIALMKLARPLTFDDKVSPIALPPSNHTPTAGVNGTVSGWGALAEGGLSPRLLHYVRVPFVNDDDCDAAYQSVGKSIVDSMICAGQTGKDACQGDSGGPLAASDLSDGSTYLAGVVSWGEGCGRDGYPGVYTEVSKYLEWIQDTIANN